MDTTTQTTTPTRPGYRAQLRPYKDEALRLKKVYYNPSTGKTDWNKAFASEPEMRDKLLVGPGDEHTKRLRLQQALNDWENPDRRDARKQRHHHVTNSGPPSTVKQHALLNAHREELAHMMAAYKDAGGDVQWKVAFRAHPQLAAAVGYQETKQWMSAFSYWWRTRVQGLSSYEATNKVVPSGAVRKQPVGAVGATAPTVQNGPAPAILAQRPVARFCSNCGHPIAVEGLAATLVAAMGNAGLSEEQIVATLTQAASAVKKVTG